MICRNKSITTRHRCTGKIGHCRALDFASLREVHRGRCSTLRLIRRAATAAPTSGHPDCRTSQREPAIGDGSKSRENQQPKSIRGCIVCCKPHTQRNSQRPRRGCGNASRISSGTPASWALRASCRSTGIAPIARPLHELDQGEKPAVARDPVEPLVFVPVTPLNQAQGGLPNDEDRSCRGSSRSGADD